MKLSEIKKHTSSLLSNSYDSLLNERSFSVFQVLLASFCISLIAQIKIPLFFTPVPLTFSTIAILTIGVCLGKNKGSLAVLCYLLQGCLGLPVWSGGNTGALYLLGPTGGYLFGWVIQAYFIGWCVEKYSPLSFQKMLSLFLASICLQLTLGSLWLAQFVGIENSLTLGIYPFLLVDSAKAFIVSLYVHYLRKEPSHETR